MIYRKAEQCQATYTQWSSNTTNDRMLRKVTTTLHLFFPLLHHLLRLLFSSTDTSNLEIHLDNLLTLIKKTILL